LARSLAVITGASSGIGATFARKLAPKCDLLLVARRKDRLEQLAAELTAAHPTNAEIFPADLSSPPDVALLAERISSETGLGLLVNNAGFGTLGRFWEAPLASQEKMHQLHVMATVRLTHAALGNMVPRNSGAIINVASVAGFVRSQGSVSYCATKSWMNVFSEGLYLELKGMRSRVTVQTLCPGFTYSEFHDTMAISRDGLAGKAFWLSAEQVVDASLAGLRDARLFVIPGWRYRVLIAIVSKLPTRLRLAVESARGKARVNPAKVQET
jgi:short-subunit dehydrogenase